MTNDVNEPHRPATHRIAFSMLLPRENIAEYRERHDRLWPEMRAAIAAQGGSNYSIFAAPELDRVFAYLEVDDLARWEAGTGNADVLRWWQYMADIMPTNEDFSPVVMDLTEVFHQA
jgi:L-rhamnose mutarotase